ncbi:MAG: hypothetical protein OXC46_08985 [Thaumarchaeota archaeon]|nr:hypothetical protein [Nitrososphaerota archaeon]
MSYDDTELTKQELTSFEKAQIKTISKTDFKQRKGINRKRWGNIWAFYQ